MKKFKKGRLIVIEGTDGAGKFTQARLLIRALKKASYDVRFVDFPQYNKLSSYFVKQYLNARFGDLKEVGPYEASLFYALDRYSASSHIKKWLNQGKVVVACRYTFSSGAHQGAKIKRLSERKKYWQWLFDLEYRLLRIPKSNLNILLHMPAKVAQQLVDKKKKRSYVGGKKRDLHEKNLTYLQQSEKVYLELAKPYHMPIIECWKDERLLSRREIHRQVWPVVSKLLK